MPAHEAQPLPSDRIRSLRARLDQIVRWSGWPKAWRPWLARRADDLVAAAMGASGQQTAAAGLQTPEEIARDILDETAPAGSATAADSGSDAAARDEAPAPPGSEAAAPERASDRHDTLPTQAAPAVSAIAGEATNGTSSGAEPARKGSDEDAEREVRTGQAVGRGPVPDLFLEKMREAMEGQSAEAERELGSLRRQEKTVFTFLLVAAGITLALLVVGAALVFAGLIAVGVLSGLVALIPGTGTLILRRLERRVALNKDRADSVRQDNLRLLQAIQITLLIDDPVQRSHKIAALSDELRANALHTGRRRSVQPA